MQLPTQISPKIVRSIYKQITALRSLPLMVALSLFLLFSQVLAPGHSHEADLLAQFECEICLKIGSFEDITVAEASSLRLSTGNQIFSILSQNQISSETVKAAARSPPSYT
jgi:hypothetical protein